MKRFEATLEKFDNQLWYYHVKIPSDIVFYYKAKKISRLICDINGQKSIHCAIMPAGDEVYFIMLNAQIRTSLNLQPGDNVSMELSEDTSEYGMPVPIEMEELFVQEPLFDQYFHDLSPGKQRSLLYFIDKLRSPPKRLEKAIILAQYLIENKGKIDYKELNDAFRKGL